MVGIVGAGALAAALGVGIFLSFSADGTDEAMAQRMLRMQYYNKALGVDCTYCHVPERFEVETPRMKTTRWMEANLVQGLVTKQGHAPIDCLSCHDGRARFLPTSPGP